MRLAPYSELVEDDRMESQLRVCPKCLTPHEILFLVNGVKSVKSMTQMAIRCDCGAAVWFHHLSVN